jgi:hypothetical protein
MNPFVQPLESRRTLLKETLVSYSLKDYEGKSFMCVFFTRFCGVGCPFCFFKSAPAREKITPADQFTEQGIDRFIEFCNQANLGYVLISGGGEPLTQKRAVLRTIEEVRTERIVLVTSGSWAMNRQAASRYIHEIHQAIQKRKQPCKVTVRLSVSEGHSIKLGLSPALHLIELFASKFREDPFLKFQIHTFRNDTLFDQVLAKFPGFVKEYDPDLRASDDEAVIKIIPQKVRVKLPNGYAFIAGVSRVFDSNLRPNLHQIDSLQKTIKIFDEDLEKSEDNNSAVLYNTDGKKGLDWSLNYNGNICLWQNQVNDNQWNLYEDSYPFILNETFRDPIPLSYIEKGRVYREKIVQEVSPRTVLRLKAISLRDYAGTVLFEDWKVRLYYMLRVLQDYFLERRIDPKAFERLPKNFQKLICGSKESLIDLYRASSHTIVDQYKQQPFDSTEWHDFLGLIALGHYDLTDLNIQDALSYYNERTELARYQSIDQLEHEKGEKIEKRLADRLMYMKPSSRRLAMAP